MTKLISREVPADNPCVFFIAASGAGFSQRILRSIMDDGARHGGIDLNDCSHAVRYAHNVYPSSITGILGYPVEEAFLKEERKKHIGWSDDTPPLPSGFGDTTMLSYLFQDKGKPTSCWNVVM
jgi:hypothetical protein